MNDDDLRTRIAEVIGTHEVWQRIVDRKTWVAPRSSWECSCGRVFALKVDYDAHVADAVIAELGLRREDNINLSHFRYVTDEQEFGPNE